MLITKKSLLLSSGISKQIIKQVVRTVKNIRKTYAQYIYKILKNIISLYIINFY